jgi:hypothetical protein
VHRKGRAKYQHTKKGLLLLRNSGFLDFCPPSSSVKTREHTVSGTECVSVLRWEETPVLLDLLERANLNHWIWLALSKGLHMVGVPP